MSIERMWTTEIDEAFNVEEFASDLLDSAVSNLKKDGYVQAAVWLVTPKELHCYSVSFSGFEEKEATYGDVVRTARDLKATAIVTLNDSYVGENYDPEAYEWGQVAANPSGEAIFVSISGPELENWSKEVRYRREAGHILCSLPVTERKTMLGLLGDWSKKGERAN